MLSELAPYNTRSHFTDGLLEVIRVLGTYITPNPDDAFDSMSAENYQHGNRTIADDLLEEIIIRLDQALGGGGGGGSVAEILRSATDLSGDVPAGYLFGYNYNNGKLFIKNSDTDWALIYDPAVGVVLNDGVNSQFVGNQVDVLTSFGGSIALTGVEIPLLDNGVIAEEHPSTIILDPVDIVVIHGLKPSSTTFGKIVVLYNRNDRNPVILVANSHLAASGKFQMKEDYVILPESCVALVSCVGGKWMLMGGEFNWAAAPNYTSQVIHNFMTVNNSDKLTYFVQNGGVNFLKTGTPGLQGVLSQRVTNTNDKSAVIAGVYGFGGGVNNLIVGGQLSVLKFNALVAYSSENDTDNEFQHNIGFMRNGNISPTNGIFFRYNNSVEKIQCVCVSGGVETVITNSFTPTGNIFFSFKILVYPDASKAIFYINDQIEGQITSNIPQGGGNEFTFGSSLHKLNGANNRDVYVDFLDFKSATKRKH